MYWVRIMGRSCLESTTFWHSEKNSANFFLSSSFLPCRSAANRSKLRLVCWRTKLTRNLPPFLRMLALRAETEVLRMLWASALHCMDRAMQQVFNRPAICRRSANDELAGVSSLLSRAEGGARGAWLHQVLERAECEAVPARPAS